MCWGCREERNPCPQEFAVCVHHRQLEFSYPFDKYLLSLSPVLSTGDWAGTRKMWSPPLENIAVEDSDSRQIAHKGDHDLCKILWRKFNMWGNGRWGRSAVERVVGETSLTRRQLGSHAKLEEPADVYNTDFQVKGMASTKAGKSLVC